MLLSNGGFRTFNVQQNVEASEKKNNTVLVHRKLYMCRLTLKFSTWDKYSLAEVKAGLGCGNIPGF